MSLTLVCDTFEVTLVVGTTVLARFKSFCRSSVDAYACFHLKCWDTCPTSRNRAIPSNPIGLLQSRLICCIRICPLNLLITDKNEQDVNATAKSLQLKPIPTYQGISSINIIYSILILTHLLLTPTLNVRYLPNVIIKE